MSLLDAIRNPLGVGAPDGVATEADMAQINRFAATPLTADQVFVYPVVMANRNMSGYAVDMGSSSLKNFARGASHGVPVHIMHDRLARNAGYTYAGHFDEATGEARAAAYLVRGRVIEDSALFGGNKKVSTNQEIADIQQGLRREVSVGCSGPFSELTCSICGKDVMDFTDPEGCPHIPGMKFDGVFATATIQNAELGELSHVDKGAIPGAVIGRRFMGEGEIILPARYVRNSNTFNSDLSEELPRLEFAFNATLALKAQSLLSARKMSLPAYREWLDARHIPDVTRSFSTPGNPNNPNQPPPPSGKEKTNMDYAELTAALLRAGVPMPEGAATAQNVADFAQAIGLQFKQRDPEQHPLVMACKAANLTTPEALRSELALSADGKAFGEQVNKDLDTQAVRVFGADKGPTFASSMKALPTGERAEIAHAWKEQADITFGVGKSRVSKPQELPVPPTFSAPADDAEDDKDIINKGVAAAVKGKYAIPTVPGGKK